MQHLYKKKSVLPYPGFFLFLEITGCIGLGGAVVLFDVLNFLNVTTKACQTLIATHTNWKQYEMTTSVNVSRIILLAILL